jgi:hypothetical protein
MCMEKSSFCGKLVVDILYKCTASGTTEQELPWRAMLGESIFGMFQNGESSYDIFETTT